VAILKKPPERAIAGRFALPYFVLPRGSALLERGKERFLMARPNGGRGRESVATSWWFALAGIPGGLVWLGLNLAVGRSWTTALVPAVLFALVFGIVSMLGRKMRRS
jgi:hypothetical protein